MQELLKTGVVPERIEHRSHKDGGIESRLIGLVQPDYRLVVVAECHIDQRNIRVRSGAFACAALQVFGYFQCLVAPS